MEFELDEDEILEEETGFEDVEGYDLLVAYDSLSLTAQESFEDAVFNEILDTHQGEEQMKMLKKVNKIFKLFGNSPAGLKAANAAKVVTKPLSFLNDAIQLVLSPLTYVGFRLLKKTTDCVKNETLCKPAKYAAVAGLAALTAPFLLPALTVETILQTPEVVRSKAANKAAGNYVIDACTGISEIDKIAPKASDTFLSEVFEL